jgi:acetyltransferase
LRLRFFVAVRGLSHRLAARPSHIDYDRDMAVLALAEGAEEVLGVARFSADPDSHAAEFAIAVRSHWKGHGPGHLLMATLIHPMRCGGWHPAVPTTWQPRETDSVAVIPKFDSNA